MNLRKSTLAVVAGTLMLASFSTSCEKKYEDDDTLELTSRTERVANTWRFQYAEQDGEDISEDYDQYELYMNTSNDATLEAQYTFLGTEYSSSTTGSWFFRNNDTELVVDFEDDEQDAEYEILRLNNDELWLRNMNNNVELHLLEK